MLIPLKCARSLLLTLIILCPPCSGTYGQHYGPADSAAIQLSTIGRGWARNSINTVIFRKNSLTTHNGRQYAAYYDDEGTVVLAKRRLGHGAWHVRETGFTANVTDAHNSISIGVDGNGILHMAWGMHGAPLQYARGTKPGGLELAAMDGMTGKNEQAVTYPRFYRLDDGDLLFMYRHGQSGSGDIMLNRYNSDTKRWQPVAHPLLAGEGKRNGYVNALAVDSAGGWHVSWTWRESWDVSTNHDMMYAYSPDEGRSWQTSTGRPYALPIGRGEAEIAREIPAGSELINQGSMTIDPEGRPVIATYWWPEGSSSPQYHIIWRDGEGWKTRQVTRRTAPFSLSGGGTKRIPVSRPQIVAGGNHHLYLIYRDRERSGGVTVAVSCDPEYRRWTLREIYRSPVGLWEPSLDRQAWKKRGVLYLLLQKVGQGDAETLEELPPQPVRVLRWVPSPYRRQNGRGNDRDVCPGGCNSQINCLNNTY